MPDLFNLSGKTSIVTGGNSGIGRGIARALAGAGAQVAIWGRNEKRNEATVSMIQADGGDAVAFGVDVSDEGGVVEAFQATIETFGKVDSVFANAGIPAGSTRFHEISAESWRRMLGVNLDGVFWTFREALRHMQPRGEGSLVVTSSITADLGFPRGEDYAATKAAVRALVRGIAAEYGRYGIRANAIAPGWVVTGMTEQFITTDKFAARTLPRIPAGRFGEPDDFSGIAVYLASDASSWHTGDTITIDGGYLVG